MKSPKKFKKDLFVKLTPEEKAELAEKLTERIDHKDCLEDAKRASQKRYAAQIEEAVAEINELSIKIRSGAEMRLVDCETRYNDPQEGFKTTYRLDTGAKVNSELMTDADMQEELFPAEENQDGGPAEKADEADPAPADEAEAKTDVKDGE
ncbi:MAG: hypothetical protein IJU70_12015 [Lentisphaeria bacterium]|nr:hypothetical protein [Lentisphaeria bacterium]